MSQTFTLPKNLIDDINILKQNLGLKDVEATIKYLLKKAVVQERKFLVARLYQNRQKTLRQCANILNVELEEMIDVLNEFGIPFHHDDLQQQLETVNRLAKAIKSPSTA
jgi:predicted HTH domain antitoxin